MVQRSYKFRFYPTAEQKKQLAMEFGHARFIWNWCLAAKQNAYRTHQETIASKELSEAISLMRDLEGYTWLKDATRACLTQKLRDLDTAFKNYFEGRARFPRFKKKREKQSVRYQIDARAKMFIPATGEAPPTLKLPKIGRVDLRWSRSINGTPKMATVSQDAAGRYWVAMAVEETIDPLPVTDKKAGIDCGIRDVAVRSDGSKSGNPKYLQHYLYRLKIAQRRLKHKTKGSGRWHRQQRKIARIHAKIADCRSDFLHQLSTSIVNENQVIAVETLKVKNMIRNRRLSRALADSAIGELLRQLKYKSQWYGRQYVEIDQWFPSSKLMSCCGHQVESMPLSVRELDCPNCGQRQDRDVNAAINIFKEGMRQLTGVDTHLTQGYESAARGAVAKRVEPDTPLAVA